MAFRLIRLFALLVAVLLLEPRLAAVSSAASESHSGAALHADGTPCQDGTDAGAPCDNGCSCVCCATIRVAPPLALLPAETTAPSLSLLPPTEPRTLRPIQRTVRLFRPPRA